MSSPNFHKSDVKVYGASSSFNTSNNPWLLYPRRLFIPLRTIQVLTSFVFILLCSIPSVAGPDAYWSICFLLPGYIAGFAVYSSTLFAYLNNPTRLSRVVVDPKLSPYPRKALLPLPNQDNLSKRGVTLAIFLIELLIAMYFLGAFVTGALLAGAGVSCQVLEVANFEGMWVEVVDDSPGKKCMSWWWGNTIGGCLVLMLMGLVSFVWGVKVYRAGWKESCKREVEREVLEGMERERGKNMRGVGVRDSGIGEAEGEVELGDIGQR